MRYILLLVAVLVLFYVVKYRKEHLSDAEFQLKRWRDGNKVVRIYEEHDYKGDYIELPVGKFNINIIPTEKYDRLIASLGSLQFAVDPGYVALLGFGVKMYESGDCDDDIIRTKDITIKENIPNLREYFISKKIRYNDITCIEVSDRLGSGESGFAYSF